MSRTYLLSADLGTTAIKAALFDESGRKILHKAEEYDLIKPAAGIVEQDPEVYWETFKSCVRYVVRESGVDPALIRAFAMDSSAETIVFMDKAMRPLDNFIVWLDGRAHDEAVEINETFSPEKIVRATGQTPIDPIYPAAKILWFKKNRPELFEKIAMMFMCDDYILWRMSGRCVSHA